MQQNVDKETSFFVVEKQFWDSWSDTPSKSKAVKDTIDNQKLIMPGHNLRWKPDVLWNNDFVVVPKHVFLSL